MIMSEPIKLKNCLLAEAIGDICGSPWEFAPYKQLTLDGLKESLEFKYLTNQTMSFKDTPLYKNFTPGIGRLPHPPFATDDTICTFAIAEAVINNTDIQNNLVKRCKQHIDIGYGEMFVRWLLSPVQRPYNSFGNGSAMRCSIAGWYYDTYNEVVDAATRTAAPTHNNIEGIKGAVETAKAIFRGRKGWTKEDIADAILEQYSEKWLHTDWSEILETYKFDVTCQGSMPVVAMALRDSNSYEDCLLRCIQSGGDADTLCAIAGPIAYSVYREIPEWMIAVADYYLPQWCKDVNEQYNKLLGFCEY
jgi:ADP-ribosylglycohydrolase